jgi:serine protease
MNCFSPILVLCLLLGSNLFAQTEKSYYWYFDKKISLAVDSSKTSVVVKKGHKIQRGFIESIANDPSVALLEKTAYEEATIVTLKSGKDNREKLVAKISGSYPEAVINYSYLKDTVSLSLLNQIILRPNSNIDDIVKRFGNHIKLLKATKYNMYVFEVLSSYSTVDIANKIHESGMVKWCEPNFFSGISAANPIYPEQYYLNNTGQLGATAGIDINAPEAWGLTTGCAIRVAVLDNGVEAHPELTGRLATGYDPLNPTNPGHQSIAMKGMAKHVQEL